MFKSLFIKKRRQHRCFPVKFTKFLRTTNLKSANDFFWNLFFHLDCPDYPGLYIWLSFCIIIYSFVCHSPFPTITTAIIYDFHIQKEIYIFSYLKFVFCNMRFIFSNMRSAFNKMKFIKLKSFTFSKPNLDVTKYTSKSIRQNEISGL